MLPDFWFVLIAVLWTGFFVLEGFDFGVAALLPVVADGPRLRLRHAKPTTAEAEARETDRRAVLATIGPVWDGNEVWLLTAGGAMFAAFPAWYASLFSGFYLALFLVLVALIVRGIGIEFRGKATTAAGRAWCDRAIVVGGVLPPVLFGVAFANLVRGVELDADGQVTSSFLDLLNPYALLGGVTVLALCLVHGSVFLTLKTSGTLRRRASTTTRQLTVPTAAVVAAFTAWTWQQRGGLAVDLLGAATVLGLAAALAAGRRHRDGWAFVATAVTLASLATTFFVAMYPDVLPALGGGDGLTIDEAASADYTLKVMTVVALVSTPVVLAYQAWSYWVFRRRLVGSDGDPDPAPPATTAMTAMTAPTASTAKLDEQ